jgi:hypothetical protein
MKRLTTTRWPDTQEVGIVGMLDLTLLTREVDTDGQSVTVSIITNRGDKFRLLGMLLEKEADGSIRKCQEEVIVRIEGVGIAGKGCLKQLQLVIAVRDGMIPQP